MDILVGAPARPLVSSTEEETEASRLDRARAVFEGDAAAIRLRQLHPILRTVGAPRKAFDITIGSAGSRSRRHWSFQPSRCRDRCVLRLTRREKPRATSNRSRHCAVCDTRRDYTALTWIKALTGDGA
jgi:hypothetical protein